MQHRAALGCVVLLLGMFVCLGTVTFAADRICYGNLSQRLPFYPDATIKMRSHNLITEFGMGNTVVIMTTPDDPETVRAWYAVHTGSYLRESLQNNTPFFRMSQGQVNVGANPDGEGSEIILFGTCIN